MGCERRVNVLADAAEQKLFYEYRSPIGILEGVTRLSVENGVLDVVRECGIDVDKESLILALEYDRAQWEEGFAAGRMGREWTRVEDGLPKKNGKYLVVSSTGQMYTIRFDPERFSRWPHFGKNDVTHWMELPEGPEVGEDDCDPV